MKLEGTLVSHRYEELRAYLAAHNLNFAKLNQLDPLLRKVARKILDLYHSDKSGHRIQGLEIRSYKYAQPQEVQKVLSELQSVAGTRAARAVQRAKTLKTKSAYHAVEVANSDLAWQEYALGKEVRNIQRDAVRHRKMSNTQLEKIFPPLVEKELLKPKPKTRKRTAEARQDCRKCHKNKAALDDDLCQWCRLRSLDESQKQRVQSRKGTF